MSQDLMLAKYPHYTTIDVEFISSGRGSQPYTYKTITPLKRGDFVVVNSPRFGFTVAKVCKVHPIAKMDRVYTWISQKVDHSEHKHAQQFQASLKEVTDEINV